MKPRPMVKNMTFDGRVRGHNFLSREGRCEFCEMSYKQYEDDRSKPHCLGKPVPKRGNLSIDEEANE
jgi:hypothetical protein